MIAATFHKMPKKWIFFVIGVLTAFTVYYWTLQFFH